MEIKPQILTEELLAKMSNKNYWNGEEIKIGDKILFAFLFDNWQPIEIINHEIKMELIILKEEHLEQFNLTPFTQRNSTTLYLVKKS